MRMLVRPVLSDERKGILGGARGEGVIEMEIGCVVCGYPG